ncbi:diaminopimelate epimerase [Synechococcus sp. CBW1004]|uniref:diaminopimelate epimerase n=1 Tax=Synechococcus sp. CBW1004 TaxID=1353136 RepID=UPI0018CF0680|nr:diaminopimelate epimerase [Synechococcus sp. CBW1004]QPN63976.1 diaminopimelate epimerase [Synechococcus sp. CBW1004]
MLQFSKYQGLGNDFLLLDSRHGLAFGDGGGPVDLDPESIRRLCDRRYGVGGDGVILALPPREGGELRMRIFNADGTEPEMCGNGIRCLARFLADTDGDSPGRSWQIETLAGRIVPELQADGRIRVDMGAPFLEPEQVPTTLPVGPQGLPQGELEVDGYRLRVAAAGMGNPHVVIPVEDVAAVDLEGLGAALEVHPAFPARTNVHFVQALQPQHLVMRVWERGAGPTLACGTGACATLVACHLLGLSERRARLDLPGGSLEIDWDDASGHLFMTGPAEAVFQGVLAPDLIALPEFPPLAPPADDDAAAMAAPLPDAAPDVIASAAPATGVPDIDCSTACVNGCVRPEACASAEARARVEALLGGRSLDELVDLATTSLESRTRARFTSGGIPVDPGV